MKIWSNLTLDLGTSKTIAYSKNGNLVMHAASYVAIDEDDNVVEVGNEAKKMHGRVQGEIKVLRPLNRGIITDERAALLMLNEFFRRYEMKGLFGTRVVATMGLDLSEGEEEAFVDLFDDLKISKLHIVPSIVAIALYAGVSVMSERGQMIVDMGAGKTEIGIISMGEVVLSRRYEIGGNDFDEAIVDYVRDRFEVLISLETAEKLKKKFGKVDTEKIVGVDTKTGLPKEVEIPIGELSDSLKEVVSEVVNSIKEAMENMNPELVEDVYNNGMILSGGLSLFARIKEKIMEETKIVVRTLDEPIESAARGAIKILLNKEFLKLTEVF